MKQAENKKCVWKIADIIDLEYFLHLREKEEDDETKKQLTKYDRFIYLNTIKPLLANGLEDTRKNILFHWLNVVRAGAKSKDETTRTLPGESFYFFQRLFGALFFLIGLVAGLKLTLYFLSYDGTEPINVTLYIAFFIVLQILLALFTLLALFGRKIFLQSTWISPFHHLLSRLLVYFVKGAVGKANKTMTGAGRSAVQALTGLLAGKKKQYGHIFFRPFFAVLQLIGIGFNLGVLGSTFLKILSTDLAFGWQSTLQVSAEAVHRLVQIIAIPWSWAFETGIGYPTLVQIQGSHMILKDGLYHLATGNLVAWWPFLLLAVLFYGLIPRVIFLVTTHWFQVQEIDSLAFDSAGCKRFVYKLQAPVLATSKSVSTATRKQGSPKNIPVESMEHALPEKEVEKIVALVPDEIFSDCPEDELKELVKKSLGLELVDKLRTGVDYKADQELLEVLSRKYPINSSCSYLILKEAWHPPIKETVSFFEELREKIGAKTMVVVGLIGKPNPKTIFTPVTDTNWNIWRDTVLSIGDPYMGLEKMVGVNE